HLRPKPGSIPCPTCPPRNSRLHSYCISTTLKSETGVSGFSSLADAHQTLREISLSSADQDRRKHRRVAPAKMASACAVRSRGPIPHQPSRSLLDRWNLLR